jgi:hypothetical protein
MTNDDNQIAGPFTAESAPALEEEVLEEITGGGRGILASLFGGCCRLPQTTETAPTPLQIPQQTETREPSVPIAKQIDQTHRVLQQFELLHPHRAGQHEVYVARDASGAMTAKIRRIR